MGRIDDIGISLKAAYPNWEYTFSQDELTAFGTLTITDCVGEFWESYTIKMVVPSNYPQNLPVVYEVSDKLKKSVSEHFFSDDNSCCLGLKTDILLKLRNNTSITNFVNLAVYPFFLQQTYRYKSSETAYLKELSHHHGGPIDFYLSYFEVENTNSALTILGRVAGILKGIGPNSKCFCSKRKLKKCIRHNLKVQQLIRYVGKNQLQNDYYLMHHLIHKK
ncbi:MAG: hypothetical protein JXR19_08465 [Bacteroidia bacterium]